MMLFVIYQLIRLYSIYISWLGLYFKNNRFLSITPPVVIGVDIYDYYYNAADAGPNARLNFLTYYFWGTLGWKFYLFFDWLLYRLFSSCKYGKI